MSSYFFHKNDKDAANLIAPPPPEYAQLTQERALWQNLGKRPEDMTAEEYFATIEMLRIEAEQKN